MINSINNNQPKDSPLTEQDVLNVKRVRVPNSARLQNNILKLTQALPQYTDQSEAAKVYDLSAFFEKVGFKKIDFWRGFKPYAATLAVGFAVIALSSTLWLPSQNDPLVVIDEFSTLTAEQLADEIEWQELMLLQDELVFAGL